MIRHFTPQDHALYRRIRTEALASDPDAFGETLEMLASRRDSELVEWLAQRIVPGKKTIAYVEQGGEPVAMAGFGISSEDPSSGILWGMFVSPNFRRRQFGKLLLTTAESWVGVCGGKVIKARVAAPNNTALRFYRSCGYLIGEPRGTLRPGSTIPSYEIEKKIAWPLRPVGTAEP
jgi:GNAT superfamily N-acetyltransferase